MPSIDDFQRGQHASFASFTRTFTDGHLERFVAISETSIRCRRPCVCAEDLIRRFDEIRRDERLDVSAAELLRDVYV
jgi:hypothetical protein